MLSYSKYFKPSQKKQNNMKTLLVPTFDEFNKYAFEGYKQIKIRNKPIHEDRSKITRLLPGIPMGYFPLPKELKSGMSFPVQSFYDGRQRTGFLKNYNITVL
jgi:hypothetical protein